MTSGTANAIGVLGAGIVTVSACYYLIDVLRGRTRPQRTSWAVWAFVGLIGFGTADAGGAGPGGYAAGVDAAACVITFAVALHPRFGKPGGRRSDVALIVLAMSAASAWRWGGLGDDAAAACCTVSCEVVALWPSVREAWRQPELESLASWTADLVGHLLCLAVVARAGLAALAFPVYMVLATATMSVVLTVRRRYATGPDRHGRRAVPGGARAIVQLRSTGRRARPASPAPEPASPASA